ncbi:hypothetical protein L596_009757 [Steinernema carpocapsae]|uniref:Uncharacterized protein n=1 Tax=Steinernema carpocapsae TaxID=34508 RepID=A0A4V6A6R2_STECR|nr:hypothetical protein L596_009757 [Steinernema carpocapsae]
MSQTEVAEALQKPKFVLPLLEPEAPLLPLEGISTDEDSAARELIKMTIVNREQPVDPKKKDKEDLELMERKSAPSNPKF